MALRQKSSTLGKGEIASGQRITVNHEARMLLKKIKEKKEEVIRIVISERTSIELPAYLTQDEIDARVANYKKLRSSII